MVGRRNVGKSTFINALAEDDRVIVSEIPGTTRDSVDVRIERDGKTFVVIDTAGVRNGRASRTTSSSIRLRGPSGRSAGRMSCCTSSTRRSRSGGSTSS